MPIQKTLLHAEKNSLSHEIKNNLSNKMVVINLKFFKPFFRILIEIFTVPLLISRDQNFFFSLSDATLT